MKLVFKYQFCYLFKEYNIGKPIATIKIVNINTNATVQHFIHLEISYHEEQKKVSYKRMNEDI